jgi:pimeloyl-ACP methyl ester carboxylesterase
VTDPAVDRSVKLRGLRFHYREYGADGAGVQPIVLLHGVASNAKIWITVGPKLGERNRAYAPDQRGHGESDKPDNGYDFASVVEDVSAFIDELKLIRPVIVGHSWGGSVALEFAATHPDSVAGLVLVDGGFMELSARPGMTWERAEKELAPPVLTHLTPEQLIAGAMKWELGNIWSDEVQAALVANFDVAEDGTIRPRLRRENHMQVVRALWEHKPSKLAPRVTCPVLFVVAERKAEGRAAEWIAMKREAVARLERRFPDCRVEWFADTIHDIPLQRPDKLAKTIADFAGSLP